MAYDSSDLNAAMSLATVQSEGLPVPLGVYYQEEREPFKLHGELKRTTADLVNLYRSRASWTQ